MIEADQIFTRESNRALHETMDDEYPDEFPQDGVLPEDILGSVVQFNRELLRSAQQALTREQFPPTGELPLHARVKSVQKPIGKPFQDAQPQTTFGMRTLDGVRIEEYPRQAVFLDAIGYNKWTDTAIRNHAQSFSGADHEMLDIKLNPRFVAAPEEYPHLYITPQNESYLTVQDFVRHYRGYPDSMMHINGILSFSQIPEEGIPPFIFAGLQFIDSQNLESLDSQIMVGHYFKAERCPQFQHIHFRFFHAHKESPYTCFSVSDCPQFTRAPLSIAAYHICFDRCPNLMTLGALEGQFVDIHDNAQLTSIDLLNGDCISIDNCPSLREINDINPQCSSLHIGDNVALEQLSPRALAAIRIAVKSGARITMPVHLWNQVAPPSRVVTEQPIIADPIPGGLPFDSPSETAPVVYEEEPIAVPHQDPPSLDKSVHNRVTQKLSPVDLAHHLAEMMADGQITGKADLPALVTSDDLRGALELTGDRMAACETEQVALSLQSYESGEWPVASLTEESIEEPLPVGFHKSIHTIIYMLGHFNDRFFSSVSENLQALYERLGKTGHLLQNILDDAYNITEPAPTDITQVIDPADCTAQFKRFSLKEKALPFLVGMIHMRVHYGDHEEVVTHDPHYINDEVLMQITDLLNIELADDLSVDDKKRFVASITACLNQIQRFRTFKEDVTDLKETEESTASVALNATVKIGAEMLPHKEKAMFIGFLKGLAQGWSRGRKLKKIERELDNPPQQPAIHINDAILQFIDRLGHFNEDLLSSISASVSNWRENATQVQRVLGTLTCDLFLETPSTDITKMVDPDGFSYQFERLSLKESRLRDLFEQLGDFESGYDNTILLQIAELLNVHIPEDTSDWTKHHFLQCISSSLTQIERVRGFQDNFIQLKDAEEGAQNYSMVGGIKFGLELARGKAFVMALGLASYLFKKALGHSDDRQDSASDKKVPADLRAPKDRDGTVTRRVKTWVKTDSQAKS